MFQHLLESLFPVFKLICVIQLWSWHFLRPKPYKGNQSRLKRYSDINESPCQHNYTCKGKQPRDPEVIDDILQSLLNMNGKFESIANFVDEVIVYKVDTMNTILGEEGVINSKIASL